MRLVEALEARRLFSAIPAHGGIEHPARPAPVTVPFPVGDELGGSYYIGSQTGSATMLINSAKGKTFSGTIEFVGDDGSDRIMTFKWTLAKFGHFKITVKSGRDTNLTGSGSYDAPNGPSNPGMTALFQRGKFEGEKILRFIPGEFALLEGLTV